MMKLIHVTTLENLEDILKNGLKYSVSREVLKHLVVINGEKNYRQGEFFIPMISFFGMTVKEHLMNVQTYGNLGIIVENIFEEEMLNPVRYINQYSILAKRIANFEDTLKNMNKGLLDAAFENSGTGFRMEAIKMYIENILYTKIFISELSRRNKKTNEFEVVNPNFFFGLEREWRLIPGKLYNNLRKITDKNSKNDEVTDYGFLKLNDKIRGFIVSSENNKEFVYNLLEKFKIDMDKNEIIVKGKYGNVE